MVTSPFCHLTGCSIFCIPASKECVFLKQVSKASLGITKSLLWPRNIPTRVGHLTRPSRQFTQAESTPKIAFPGSREMKTRSQGSRLEGGRARQSFSAWVRETAGEGELRRKQKLSIGSESDVIPAIGFQPQSRRDTEAIKLRPPLCASVLFVFIRVPSLCAFVILLCSLRLCRSAYGLVSLAFL